MSRSVAQPSSGEKLFARRHWKVLGAAAVALLFVLAVWFSRRGTSALAADNPGERTAKVQRRDFVQSLRLHGTTAAVDSYPVTVPRMAGQPGGALIITHLALSGSPVRPGDIIVEFDRQNQIRNALDRRAEFLDLEEQIKKKKAEQDAANARDETDLTQARNDLEKARWETQRNEVISKIDAEKNNQRLQEGQARLKQIEQTKELKQTAYTADMRILEIRRDRARNAMKYAEGNSEKMAIKSPIAGLVVISSIWKAGSMGEVLEGDEVRPGSPIMQVVNPNSMEVRTRVNQADVPFLRPGQGAEFRLEAFPSLVFRGKLERIAAMGSSSGLNDYVRTFNAVFSVEGSDTHLLPDLAAAVDAELQRIGYALVVPRDALLYEDGKTFVRVQRGNSWEQRPVKVLGVSNVDAALESGVQPGDVVLLGTAPGGKRP